MSDLKNKIEAILFASGKGVSEEDLAKYCESSPKKILKELKLLEEEFIKRDGSLIISNHNNKWKLTVRSKYSKDIEHIASETEFSGSILKTLAVIAFKSPVLQSDIVHMRGQGAYDHIKILAKEKFITKEDEGRSYILKITDKFYNYFDVEGDEEIRDVFEQLKKQQQKITELEIIEMTKVQEEQDEKIKQKMFGNLEVVEAKPITNEKTQEDKEREQNFLNRIDEQIQEASQRIESHKLPLKIPQEEQDEKEQEKNLEEENNNTESKTENESLLDTHSQENKKDENEDYLKELDEFAQKNTKENNHSKKDNLSSEDYI